MYKFMIYCYAEPLDIPADASHVVMIDAEHQTSAHDQMTELAFNRAVELSEERSAQVTITWTRDDMDKCYFRIGNRGIERWELTDKRRETQQKVSANDTNS